jgi:hypothetical protein
MQRAPRREQRPRLKQLRDQAAALLLLLQIALHAAGDV